MTQAKITTSLFVMRASIAAFFSIWALEKFLEPETTVAIWKAFYMVENLPLAASYGIGVVQAIAILLFFFGVLKFWSYGFLMTIHGLSTLASYKQLLDPYSGSNHLFWAAIPTLGALIALFILRDQDTLFTYKSKRHNGE